MEREKIIILHARAYSFVNKETGEILEGIKIKYLMTDKLAPIVIDKVEKGYDVAECSIPLINSKDITNIPGIYYPNYVKTIKKGQVIQKLNSVEFCEDLPNGKK